MIDLLCSPWTHSYCSPAPWTKYSILLTEMSSKLRGFTQWQPTSLYLNVTKSSDTENVSHCLDACLHLLHSGLFTSPILNSCPFKWYILSWLMLRLSSSPGYFKRALACLCPHIDCWCTSRFLLVQSLITPLATFADVPSAGPISYLISINFHLSWHPHQLDPLMFCQFHQGLMAVPD